MYVQMLDIYIEKIEKNRKYKKNLIFSKISCIFSKISQYFPTLHRYHISVTNREQAAWCSGNILTVQLLLPCEIYFSSSTLYTTAECSRLQVMRRVTVTDLMLLSSIINGVKVLTKETPQKQVFW